ncbi:MAG: Saccharopine dehydrogenase [Geoglossum simile]|nr:MAG: Saccharopine dehydrogenase [Geoglossum simile]
MASTVLHFRSETKLFERRSPLTSTTAKALLDAGYERSLGRVFADKEFGAIGATLVLEGSWVDVPKDHIIVGLKELPEDDTPLYHSHIQFGHCYENWDRYTSRFARGGGTLYDLEFLTDDSGRCVSAFGYYAGYAGAATALLAWSQVVESTTLLPSIRKYPSAPALLGDVNTSLTSALPQENNQHPNILIMGALGRCGKGAVGFCIAAGIPTSNLLKWDMEETSRRRAIHPNRSRRHLYQLCLSLHSSPPSSPQHLNSNPKTSLTVYF